MVNLAFHASTNGIVHFEVFDALGEKKINATLGDKETFAQYSTTDFDNGVYYWRLRDNTRTIKTGKLVIMK